MLRLKSKQLENQFDLFDFSRTEDIMGPESYRGIDPSVSKEG